MKTDKRTDGWPFSETPRTTLLSMAIYLSFVRGWGPKMMEKRPPFELRGVLMFYNVLQIIFNGWMFQQSLRITWFYLKLHLIEIQIFTNYYILGSTGTV